MNLQKRIKMSTQNKLISTSLADSMFNKLTYTQDSFPTDFFFNLRDSAGSNSTALIYYAVQ